MLKQTRPGERPVLGDVTHQYRRGHAALAGVHNLRGYGPDLTDVAGQTVRAFRGERLYGVDNEQIRRGVPFQQGEHVLDPRCGDGQKIVVQHAQTVGAILDLRQRFLAAHVERNPARRGHRARHLEEQRGFADSRLAAHEKGAARHQPPPEHAVERVKPGPERLMPVFLHVGQGDGLHRPEASHWALTASLRRGRHQFKSIPRLAGKALPPPQGRLGPALRAHVGLAYLAHARPFKNDVERGGNQQLP